MANLPLSMALSQLRDELRAARLTTDPELRLKITAIQLDLALEATNQRAGEVGASVWSVLTAKAALERSEAHTHRLSLTIEPVAIDERGHRADLEISTAPIPDND